MGGPSIFSNPFQATGQAIGDQIGSINSVNLLNSTRQDIIGASLDDATRASLLQQIDAIGAVGTQDRLNRLQPIMDTLNAKKALSTQVASLYQNAIANASKNQSTIITSGQPAAVVSTGNGSVITGGKY